MPIDRTFIDKYDSFLFTIRKILYYGDTNSKLQPVNPKHDRWRFINYFGYDINQELYHDKTDSFDFDNDDRLKDEFANTYCYKSLNVIQLGDYCTIFSKLSGEEKMADSISGSRSLKNINRRLENDEELIQSGSVLSFGKSKKRYKSNVDISSGITNKERVIEALDFAIKKNNFSAFASTYKRLLMIREGCDNISCNIEIDHQIFHPILDEKHIWDLVSAITETKKIDIKYCDKNCDFNQMNTVDNLVPLKLVYDCLYGRTYLFAHRNNETITLRVDRIYSIDFADSFYSDEYKEILDALNEKLKTAWTVSINDSLYHVVLRFENTKELKARIKNEGRIGKITEENDQYFYYEVDVNDYTEMTSWVLSFGSRCKAIEPQPLVDRIIEHLEVMSK